VRAVAAPVRPDPQKWPPVDAQREPDFTLNAEREPGFTFGDGGGAEAAMAPGEGRATRGEVAKKPEVPSGFIILVATSQLVG
jgi:hypothetical protein